MAECGSGELEPEEDLGSDHRRIALEEREGEERDQAPEGATTLPAVCGSDCAVSAKLLPLCYRHHLV